jgi:hypothetical protein
MAILKDHYNNKFLKLELIFRDNRPNQGCIFLIISNDTGSNVTSEFGWTNTTLDKLVEMLKKFPMHFYDDYFSHYDESFEWKWIHGGRLLTFKASIENIREFSTQILNDIENAPT